MGDRSGRSGRRTPLSIILELDRLEQLFDVSGFEIGGARPRVVPGLDEAFAVTRAEDPRRPVQLSIRLSAAAAADVDEPEARLAVASYCGLRAREVEREKDALMSDGRSSLGIGILVLAVGLIVSQAIHHVDLPEQLDTFLGDGLFLVVAWVGLWYPIDTLLYGRRDAGRRAAAWRSLQRASVSIATFE